MKMRTTKKLLFSALLIALCFTFIKAPVISPTVPEDVQTQVMPCSGLEGDDHSNNN